MGLKLPNSGNLLKLKVLSHNLNIIGGCSNQACKVISLEMIEREMDNRASKLNNTLFIKEQRIYGSWCINKLLIHLRYILQYFERNSLVKNLSKQLNINKFSTFNLFRDLIMNSSLLATMCKKSSILQLKPKLIQNYTTNTLSNNVELTKFNIHPWFIVGFTDAEGSFMVSIIKNSKYKLGWEVQLTFQIKLHKRDLTLLKSIQDKLGGIGKMTIGKNDCVLRVRNLTQILELIKFFDEYKLITQKKADYLIFKKIAILMQQNKHLTIEGLQEIVNLKVGLNLGLSDVLKSAFPNTTPVNKPIVENQLIPHSQWMSGFTSGEGCFSVVFSKDKYKYLSFKVTQHSRDKQLMESFIEYWKCEYYSPGVGIGNYKVTKFSDLIEIIIPFFKENPILGVKALDFEDFCLVASIVESREHILDEGMKKIREIKAQMNKGRKNK